MKLTPSVVFAVCLAAGSTGFAASKTAASASVAPRSAESLTNLLAKGDMAAMQKALGEPLLAAGATGLGRADVQAGLARHEFLRVCGADALAELSKREGGAAFLKAFLSDATWIDSFLISDPPAVGYKQAAENLRLLHHYGKGFEVPLYRRLATAMALSAGKMTPYLLVERFGQIERAHRDGLLHVSFDSLDVREMRWAVYLGGNAADYEYLLNDRQTRLGDYLGACWAVAYRGDNDYGDSIQGPWYHLAFRHGYPGWQSARAVGGVCGSLSTYGSLVTRAHGIPSTPVGQPGHCAYIVRMGDEWPVGNSVTWPTATSSPGWEGTGYATMARLYEPVSKDGPRLLSANRATWLARLQIDQQRPAEQWIATYNRAVAAQPLNFDVWLEYAKAVTGRKEIADSLRLDLAKQAAKSFAGYPEAAWALVQRFADNALNGLTPDARKTFLLERHADLREKNADRYVDWPFEGMLDWQAGKLGDAPEARVAYFSGLLEIHAADAPYNHVFGRVMGWGQARFAANPKTAPLFAQAMQSYFQSRGSAADPGMMSSQIAEGLRAASNAGDLTTFQLWAKMRSELLQELKPEDIYLNSKQREAFPKLDAFPGQVLSAKGMLKISSAGQFDKPLSHPAVLQAGGFGGYFDTNGEDAPSATVQLPGEGELSGIVIVNRYEFDSETEWSLPLKVSYSEDGKTWTEAALFNIAEPAYRVDLAGKGAKARFVKVERLPGRKDRFHLRNILVYGKPLY